MQTPLTTSGLEAGQPAIAQTPFPIWVAFHLSRRTPHDQGARPGGLQFLVDWRGELAESCGREARSLLLKHHEARLGAGRKETPISHMNKRARRAIVEADSRREAEAAHAVSSRAGAQSVQGVWRQWLLRARAAAQHLQGVRRQRHV